MVQHNLQKATIIDFGFANFDTSAQRTDIISCGTILEEMSEAGLMGKQAQGFIDLLLGGEVTATEALSHAWFEAGLFSRLFRWNPWEECLKSLKGCLML